MAFGLEVICKLKGGIKSVWLYNYSDGYLLDFSNEWAVSRRFTRYGSGFLVRGAGTADFRLQDYWRERGLNVLWLYNCLRFLLLGVYARRAYYGY